MSIMKRRITNSGRWGTPSLAAAVASFETSVLSTSVTTTIDNLAILLHRCRKEKNASCAERLFACMNQNELTNHELLGNYAVSMLSAVGNMNAAIQVFDKLLHRSQSSWNSLVAGYVKCGKFNSAFSIYKEMVENCVRPDVGSYVALIKACTKLCDVGIGYELHVEISRKCFDRHNFVATGLVDMYAKCGILYKAQEIFDNLKLRDVVSWTSILSGYVKHGYDEIALNLFERMEVEGVHPNDVTFFCILKACGSLGFIYKGQEVHAEIARKGMERDLYVGSSLVDMYAKFCLLGKAEEVLYRLPGRDVVSYNALISGYSNQNSVEEVMKCFLKMQIDGISPTTVTFASIVKVCASIGDGQEIHAEISRKGLEGDLMVGNALIDMYANFGSLSKAKHVFDSLLERDVISWTTIISGYARHGCSNEALRCFEEMQHDGVTPNSITFISSLSACCAGEALNKGVEIHVEIYRQGLQNDSLIGSMLVDMYAKFGFLSKAQETFHLLVYGDVVCWNALQAGYVEHGYENEALECLETMQIHCVFPDAVTFACSLKACGLLGTISKGQEIHAAAQANGFLETDIVVSNSLIDMYAKCGFLSKSQAVFEKLPSRDVASWNAFIMGCAQLGHCTMAWEYFKQMESGGIVPDSVSFLCILKICSELGSLEKAEEVHSMILDKRLLNESLVSNALIDMYANLGLLDKALDVFDKLPDPDLVSWTALIAGYCKHQCYEEALVCYEWMQLNGISPDALTFVCVLRACCCENVINKGIEVHAEISRKELQRDLIVVNSLIDLYASLGMVGRAQDLFSKLSIRDVISWATLIAGYAQLGHIDAVFRALNDMMECGQEPNSITFVSVLNACSHAGLVQMGQEYFQALNNIYEINPTVEHYICLVDIFSRAGQLENTVEIIENMPFHPTPLVWHCLLGACRKWGNMELGAWVFENAVSLDKDDTAVYICMSNIFADCSWGLVIEVEY